MATSTTAPAAVGTRDLSHGRMILWAAGTHASSAMIGVLVVFFLFYCTNVLGLSAFVAGQILFWVRVYDFFADIAIGWASDRSRSALGRRRPFLAVGAVLSLAGFLMLFRVPQLGSAGMTAAYVAAALVLYTTAYSVFNVPHLAMPAEITSDRHTRTLMMAWRMIFFTTANLLTLIGGNILIRKFPGAQGYTMMGMLVGGSVFISMLVAFFGTKGFRALPPTTTQEPLARQLQLIGQNRPFRLFIVAKMSMLAAQASTTGAMLYFGEYVLHRPDILQVFGVWVTLGTLGSAPVWAAASRRFGKKACFITACLVYATVMMTWLFAGPAEPNLLLNTRVLLLGVTLGGILIIGFSILPDTMAYDRERTGLNREGIYAGLYSLMEKAANAAGPLLFATYLAASGYVSSTDGRAIAQPDAAISAIYVALGVFPAACALLAAFIFARYPEPPR